MQRYLLLILLVAAPCFAQDSIDSSLKQAIVLYKQGNYNESLANLLELEKANHSDKTIPYFIGMNYFELSQYDKAELFFRKSIAIDPDFENALLELGNLQIAKHNIQEAKMLIERALKINPKSAPAHLNYSNVFFLLNDNEHAGAEIMAAAELDPMLIMNHGMNIFMNNQKPEAALYYLKFAERVIPNDPLLLFNVPYGEWEKIPRL
jgi:tetratricopeptide (TPR) repeat protein